MKLFLSILVIFSASQIFALEDTGKGLTCKQLTSSSDILKCSDGKYYAPTGEILSYQDNKDIVEGKRDLKARSSDSYQPGVQPSTTSSNISK